MSHHLAAYIIGGVIAAAIAFVFWRVWSGDFDNVQGAPAMSGKDLTRRFRKMLAKKKDEGQSE